MKSEFEDTTEVWFSPMRKKDGLVLPIFKSTAAAAMFGLDPRYYKPVMTEMKFIRSFDLKWRDFNDR